MACLHDRNKSGFFGGPAFIQPIRAIWKVFKKPWLAEKKNTFSCEQASVYFGLNLARNAYLNDCKKRADAFSRPALQGMCPHLLSLLLRHCNVANASTVNTELKLTNFNDIRMGVSRGGRGQGPLDFHTWYWYSRWMNLPIMNVPKVMNLRYLLVYTLYPYHVAFFRAVIILG